MALNFVRFFEGTNMLLVVSKLDYFFLLLQTVYIFLVIRFVIHQNNIDKDLFHGTAPMIPRFFWLRKKMLTKFQEILDKDLPEVYLPDETDLTADKMKLEKRYNPMFYPSWQARDGRFDVSFNNV